MFDVFRNFMNTMQWLRARSPHIRMFEISHAHGSKITNSWFTGKDFIVNDFMVTLATSPHPVRRGWGGGVRFRPCINTLYSSTPNCCRDVWRDKIGPYSKIVLRGGLISLLFFIFPTIFLLIFLSVNAVATRRIFFAHRVTERLREEV